MTKQVEVQVTKTYYKSTTLTVDVPGHLTDDEVHTFIEKLNDKTNNLTDELADASLNEDMGGVEIEII